MGIALRWVVVSWEKDKESWEKKEERNYQLMLKFEHTLSAIESMFKMK